MKLGTYCIYKGIEYELNGDEKGHDIILTIDVTKVDATFTNDPGSRVFYKQIELCLGQEIMKQRKN